MRKPLLSREYSEAVKGERPTRLRLYGYPENKAAVTRGTTLLGKITLDQYLMLVNLGCDGDTIKAWTCYRASQEIGRRLTQQNRPTRK